MRFLTCLASAVIVLALCGAAGAAGQRILVQSTTSTENSGLYDHLLPLFEAKTGWDVDVVAVGTGQAIHNAEAGDADVLLVHARTAEDAFVAAGFGIERFDLMYNDFVIVGPTSDPAGVGGAELADALVALMAGKAPFISRGDDSGTHKKELALWAAGAPIGSWYREAGAGMGATLRVAIETDGYTLTDRATWIAYGAKEDHRVLVEGDPALFNQYGIIAVNPARHPHVNAKGAVALIGWLLSSEGQQAIAAYNIAGQQLFHPNAQSGL
jgi:tungstate transport system substrate-binding protein